MTYKYLNIKHDPEDDGKYVLDITYIVSRRILGPDPELSGACMHGMCYIAAPEGLTCAGAQGWHVCPLV